MMRMFRKNWKETSVKKYFYESYIFLKTVACGKEVSNRLKVENIFHCSFFAPMDAPENPLEMLKLLEALVKTTSKAVPDASIAENELIANSFLRRSWATKIL